MSQKMQYSLSYMPQLDSLRAIAALGVYAQHFLHKGNLFRSTIPLGDLGVRLFFVLSGFLITGILLKSRNSIESKTINSRNVIYHFYMRRLLRLLPVFYIFLILNIIFNPEIKQYALWFFLYLQNIHFAILGNFSFAEHLWTLAVEEQFYLVWPLLIIFTPQRWLLPLIIIIVLSGTLFRITFISLGLTHFQSSMLTPSHFDTLGLGGVLSILFTFRPKYEKYLKTILTICFFSGFIILSGVLVSKLMGMSSTIEFIFGELGAGLIFTWLIGISATGKTGKLGVILNSPILIYLGKISYGMYVYHWFVPHIVKYLTEIYGISLPTNEWFQLGFFSLISIVIAIVSWHLLEKPILGLKRKFSYTS